MRNRKLLSQILSICTSDNGPFVASEKVHLACRNMNPDVPSSVLRAKVDEAIDYLLLAELIRPLRNEDARTSSLSFSLTKTGWIAEKDYLNDNITPNSFEEQPCTELWRSRWKKRAT